MAQNLDDDAGFFAGYSKLERSVRGLDGAAEWPALRRRMDELEARISTSGGRAPSRSRPARSGRAS